jgi:hypothetical protein
MRRRAQNIGIEPHFSLPQAQTWVVGAAAPLLFQGCQFEDAFLVFRFKSEVQDSSSLPEIDSHPDGRDDDFFPPAWCVD